MKVTISEVATGAQDMVTEVYVVTKTDFKVERLRLDDGRRVDLPDLIEIL